MLSISRRVDQARRAFAHGDKDTARKLHDPQTIEARIKNTNGRGIGGTYIGDMVYGGLDGIITTFAVVSGVEGAQLAASIILILGVANLLADGFSMGVGDYLSTRSEDEYYDFEARRQAWEIENVPDGQRAELEALYKAHGYSDEDAAQMVDIQTRNQERWISAMMVEELNMVKEDASPVRKGLATFLSFIVAGSVPLLVYVIGLFTPIAPQTAFPISVILSAIALFLLGAAKYLVTGLHPIRSGIEMLVVGGLAAVVAFVIGVLLRGVGSGGA